MNRTLVAMFVCFSGWMMIAFAQITHNPAAAIGGLAQILWAWRLEDDK